MDSFNPNIAGSYVVIKSFLLRFKKQPIRKIRLNGLFWIPVIHT